jgi:hypothetical protein
MTNNRTTRSSVIKILIGAAAGIIIVVGIYKFSSYAYTAPRGEAVATITKNVPEDRATFAELIQINYEEYRNNSQNWSLVAFSCVFLAAIFSALAGLVLKLEFLEKKAGNALQKDIAAILAVVASVLMVISTNGDFIRKWQANRAAAAGMENLAYDLLKEPFDAERKEAILSEIKAINLKRNLDIIGETKSNEKGQGNTNEKGNPANSNALSNKPANNNTNANRK